MQPYAVARRFCFLAAGLVLTGSVAAQDGYALEIGNGNDGVKIVRLSTSIRQWQRPQKNENSDHDMQIFWELGLARWQAQDSSGERDLLDVSATPVLRFSPHHSAPRAYADLAIGVHVLTEHRIGERELSTPYHFGSFAGIGVELGDGRYDLGIRIQHLSNASVDIPNPGINFTLLRLGIRF
jgi:hypothetical protein